MPGLESITNHAVLKVASWTQIQMVQCQVMARCQTEKAKLWSNMAAVLLVQQSKSTGGGMILGERQKPPNVYHNADRRRPSRIK
jgi:hypothetical protein